MQIFRHAGRDSDAQLGEMSFCIASVKRLLGVVNAGIPAIGHLVPLSGL